MKAPVAGSNPVDSTEDDGIEPVEPKTVYEPELPLVTFMGGVCIGLVIVAAYWWL